MKKIYINELETERRNELIKKNSKLIELLQRDLYDNNMDLQYIEGNNIVDTLILIPKTELINA